MGKGNEKNTNRKNTIEEMREVARRKGGYCLSINYINSGTKLKWQCKEGHIWEAVPRDVSREHWCPKCAGNERLTIEYMKSVAIAKGGQCLSTVYKNNWTNLRWKCAYGHEWDARPNNILNGTWCPCCNSDPKHTLEEMINIAKSKGGECLSYKYVNLKMLLKWRCACGHEWEAPGGRILHADSWCPICANSMYLGQEKCRYILEKIFNKPFKLTRTILGKKYELDGYNKDLKLAFEYNGVQHYEYRDIFHKVYDEFIRQQERDKYKKLKCKEKDIKLATIPYWIADKGDKVLIDFIFSSMKSLEIKYAILDKDIDMMEFYKTYTPMGQLIKLAKSKGGECLSTEYISNGTKMHWICANGHKWEARANDIKRGHWCPFCAKVAKLSLDEMIELATSKGGYCLSNEYNTCRTKLKWLCEKGHVWEATSGSVKQGYWCPICGGTAKLSLDVFRKIAESKGGKCLSEEYINCKQKLKWQCSEGHVWVAISSNVKSGHWCPICGRKVFKKHTDTIEHMKMIAKERGGECLSTEYLGIETKLTWRCSERHVWEAIPNNVKRGSWCPVCFGNAKLSLDIFKEIAESKGGKCLSVEYINDSRKMKWQCAKGHMWEARAHDIKRGHWCPKCARKRAHKSVGVQ